MVVVVMILGCKNEMLINKKEDKSLDDFAESNPVQVRPPVTIGASKLMKYPIIHRYFIHFTKRAPGSKTKVLDTSK